MCAELDQESQDFYVRSLRMLKQSGIPFLVGGAYALAKYTGVVRHTKDLDVCVRPRDVNRVLALFANEGFATERSFPHWLAKVYRDHAFLDVIYSSGNGLCDVDDDWFRYAVEADVMGVRVGLCPPEEMIWCKAFIQERERYDGADVAHLIRSRGDSLDWERLVARFGPHWRVLLGHLVLFGYIYPDERERVPDRVIRELLGRLALDPPPSTPSGDRPLCQGTFLSREQYLVDVEQWGYQDARLAPIGPMSRDDVASWTAAIGDNHEHQAAGMAHH
jgi:hypothetical protein